MTAKYEGTWPGHFSPLGATWDGEGTNFALFSEGAEAVDLSLFDDDGQRKWPAARGSDGAHLARLRASRRTGPALRLSV